MVTFNVLYAIFRYPNNTTHALSEHFPMIEHELLVQVTEVLSKRWQRGVPEGSGWIKGSEEGWRITTRGVCVATEALRVLRIDMQAMNSELLERARQRASKQS
jgi:hypothetical protein